MALLNQTLYIYGNAELNPVYGNIWTFGAEIYERAKPVRIPSTGRSKMSNLWNHGSIIFIMLAYLTQA